MLTYLLGRLHGPPAFRIYGRGKPEADWRVIDIHATSRRNRQDGWPILAGFCITWTSRVIVVGMDFAEGLLREQLAAPASREQPVEVYSGRLHRGRAPDAPGSVSYSEVLAHECGHTFQATRLGPLYLPTGALFTWWREGSHWWNRFENRASERGQFGGLVSDSVMPAFWERATRDLPR